MKNKFFDITNLKKLKKTFINYKPDYVFHLAPQSLVKKSYEDPLLTYQTNTIGTLNVMECLRSLTNNCIAIIITSDKSYKNLEIKRGYREEDILGGIDPYRLLKSICRIDYPDLFQFILNKKKY